MPFRNLCSSPLSPQSLPAAWTYPRDLPHRMLPASMLLLGSLLPLHPAKNYGLAQASSFLASPLYMRLRATAWGSSQVSITASSPFRPTWGHWAVLLLVGSAPVTHTVAPVTHSRPQWLGYCLCTSGLLATAVRDHSAINTSV